MVVFQGYCRPLKQKVEFQVESVNRLETKRGIKWSVKGHYEGNKISTFTNEENAQRLLGQLTNTVVEEPMEVFGAEIAYQEAEGEVECNDCGKSFDLSETKTWVDDERYCADCLDFQRKQALKDDEALQREEENERIVRAIRRDRGDEYYAENKGAEDTRSELTAKHYKKDGSLDLRYKICRLINASEKKNAEESQSQTKKEDKDIDDEVEEILTEAAVDEVLESETWQGKSLAGSLDEIEEMLGRKKEAEESFDAETYQKVYRAEPNAIIFEEHIPPEIWNIMGSDAQGHYLATRDESVLIAPCCGVTKAEIRVDNDANIECGSCVFSGDDFHPRWWADKPVPKVRKVMDAEELPMEDLYGNTATVPADVYYRFMLQLPPTVSATPTDDGFSMILGFHNQNAEFVENLIEAYSPYEDAGDSQDTLYAEDISFVPKNSTGAVLTLNKFAEELNKYEAEMSCPPATQDVAINTKNRNATIKNFGYGPLNVDEPGDFWEDIAKQWKTTVKAAKKSKCGNCVAFDRSPRMKSCMPGETSDGEGVLGYCWMHHFKCHSARTCDTWAKGGPITTDKVSEGWQERAFAKTKASKTAIEAGKATAKASESFEATGGKRMYCSNCKVNRTWNKGYKKQNIDYSKGEKPSDFIFYVCQKCDYAYDPKTSKKLEDNWRKMFGYDAESFDVEFEEWGKQEMLTHGKDVSFKDWLEEEADSHGDMPLVEWAKDEEKSHDERYEAEGDPHDAKNFDKWCQTCGSYDKNPTLPEGYCDECICVGCNETYSSGPSYAYCEICYEENYPDEGKDYDRSGYYAENFEAESDKPVNKTLVGVLGVGVLGAIFAPKYVKSLFDKIKKR